MNILLTGCAGFIGGRTAHMLLQGGHTVIGIDNLNDYYDVRLKQYRLDLLKPFANFVFYKDDIEDIHALDRVFQAHSIDAILNLAARAGVRYSIQNPHVYMSTNAQGTLNLLELMRKYKVRKLVLASTSSLYAGHAMPFKEDLPVNTPISPYAASKKAAEMMAYTYHYLFGMDVTVLRYFTVYGPAGRPDMSIFRFIRWIDERKELILYGDGSQSRDFTYVDDIAEGTIRAIELPGFEIINLGGDHPYSMLDAISFIENSLGKKAVVKYLPFPKTDVLATWADISKARALLQWEPKVSLEAGLGAAIEWYQKNESWAREIQIDTDV